MVHAVLRGGVNPSMNPSRVQLRRYAILGYAHHSHPEVLVNHLYGLGYCSSGQVERGAINPGLLRSYLKC